MTGSATSGLADGGASLWTSGGTTGCGSVPVRIYCFGVDRNVPVTVKPESTRRAFVSRSALPGHAGIAAFDNACATDALELPGAPGTFLAALPLGDQSATERFKPFRAVPWVRVDGVTVFDFGVPQQAPLELDVLGVRSAPTGVWTGGGFPQKNCGDWADVLSTAVGNAGDEARSTSNAFETSCTTLLRVYCLEE